VLVANLHPSYQLGTGDWGLGIGDDIYSLLPLLPLLPLLLLVPSSLYLTPSADAHHPLGTFDSEMRLERWLFSLEEEKSTFVGNCPPDFQACYSHYVAWRSPTVDKTPS